MSRAALFPHASSSGEVCVCVCVCGEFHVCCGFPLGCSPAVQRYAVRLTDVFELPVVCLCPLMDWHPVEGIPLPVLSGLDSVPNDRIRDN